MHFFCFINFFAIIFCLQVLHCKVEARFLTSQCETTPDIIYTGEIKNSDKLRMENLHKRMVVFSGTCIPFNWTTRSLPFYLTKNNGTFHNFIQTWSIQSNIKSNELNIQLLASVLSFDPDTIIISNHDCVSTVLIN